MTSPAVPELTRLEELAEKIRRQCNAADKRADRRCVARAEVRLDSIELRPLLALVDAAPSLLAAYRAVERAKAVLDTRDPMDDADELSAKVRAALGSTEPKDGAE